MMRDPDPRHGAVHDLWTDSERARGVRINTLTTWASRKLSTSLAGLTKIAKTLAD